MAIVKQVGMRRLVEKSGRYTATKYESYLQKGEQREMPNQDTMDVAEYVDYLQKGCPEGAEAHYEGCSSKWAEDFKLTARSWNKLSNNVAVEYVQSWGPEETKRMGHETLFRIGVETAKEIYPNHQFIVVPEVSKKGNFHNHILICTVSLETGKRIESNFAERAKITKATDNRCIALGLSVPDRSKSKAKEKLSKEAHQMLKKRGKGPIEYQLMQAADTARTYAIDLDDFISTLGSMGFQVEDRGKVLTYFHPNREKGIRDRRIGENYNKEGLNERFELNRKVYEQRPELRALLREQIGLLYDGAGNLVGDASKFPFAPGGHQRFEKRSSPEQAEVARSGRDRGTDSVDLAPYRGFLARHIDATRSLSIVDYCDKNRIALNPNDDGSYRLRGREHILIRGTTWESTKEKKGVRVGGQGGLLEFVQNHRDLSVMGALSELTGNKSFLLLEDYFGKPESTYRVFHVPKAKLAPEKTALEKLNHFAKAFGKNTAWSRAVLNSKRVEVTTEGVIRFLFGKGEGAVEHKQDGNGKWLKKTLGVVRGGLIFQEGSSPTAHVFRDPFSFMEETQGRGRMAFPGSASILVLGDKADHSLDFFLAANPHIKKVEFIGFGSHERSFEKHRLLSRKDLSFEFMQTGGGSRGRGKGIDIEIKI